jgi:uncharacterized protein YbaR (Trm112 family)/2-polyprenyl-3-methyl-5-hydroxy-6-metoxy-1,4-benzoquinol methylase
MKPSLLKILACPQCLTDLELNIKTFKGDEIVLGDLWCPSCDIAFPIKDGVSIFGLRRENATEGFREIDAENRWVYDVNKLQVHIDYAVESSKYVENLIPKLNQRIRRSIENQRLRVLDLGAGWGAFQSWQFSKYGFEVIALELCPEFVFATDYVLQNGGVFFERSIADCTLLPFRNGAFDMIFCKEVAHHIKDLDGLFSEISRIASLNSVIIVSESCKSILQRARARYKNKSKDRGAEAGLTHQNYTFFDYITHMNTVAKDIEEDVLEIFTRFSILSKNMERILDRMPSKGRLSVLRKIVLATVMILVGGQVELIGTTKLHRDYISTNRHIIPINLDNLSLNEQKLKYYRNELIPEVFKVFSAVHEEYARKFSHAKVRALRP